jgi:hypothetical protein
MTQLDIGKLYHNKTVLSPMVDKSMEKEKKNNVLNIWLVIVDFEKSCLSQYYKVFIFQTCFIHKKPFHTSH